MALNGLLDIDLAVKNPQELCEFWERHGLNSPSDGVLGTDDRKKQITVVEDDYRHLDALHLSCEFESDLAAIAQRIGEMGVESKISGTNLDTRWHRCRSRQISQRWRHHYNDYRGHRHDD